MSRNPRFAVIGGGIIGAAVAREVQLRIPDAEVVLFEKEDRVGAHQTGHNSGVVHAGLYYEPGSLKAQLCRRGVHLLEEFVAKNDVPYEQCGKVVVALDAIEQQRLEAIYGRATQNRVPGVRLIGAEELGEIEPNAVGRGAVYSPETAIVDYRRMTECLVEELTAAGGVTRLGTRVDAADDDGQRVVLSTSAGDATFDYAIACAGLQSDRLARRAGAAQSPSIVPFFGQYLVLEPKYSDVTNGLVYPVPDPNYPFLGVHLTKRVDGAMTVGPNAFLSFSREMYRGLGINVRDSLSIATDPGFWRFASKNLSSALREIQGVLSPKHFIEQAARYVPAIADARATRAPRGIRAQALDREGTLVDDFVLEHLGRVTHIRNAPSPGATSSLAIAEHIVQTVVAEHALKTFSG